MKVLNGLDAEGLPVSSSVLTIGNFDGMHRGHQQLLAQGALFAADDSVPLVAVTFEPHPLTVVRPKHAPECLSPLPEKLHLLSLAGVDVTVVAASTPDLLGLEPERFIEQMVDRFHPVRIVEGSTFGFGRGRRGTPAMLQELGKRFGFQVCIIDPVSLRIEDDASVPVSSSVIRSLLREGKVHQAELCLGRPYRLRGRVTSGAGRGAGMGFPTANLGNVQQLIPADGVYAGLASMDDGRYPAAVSIGTRPTFSGESRLVEAHLLYLSADLRGQEIHLEFRSWLRAQRKFDSAEGLAEQIAADVEAVRRAVSP